MTPFALIELLNLKHIACDLLILACIRKNKFSNRLLILQQRTGLAKFQKMIMLITNNTFPPF